MNESQQRFFKRAIANYGIILNSEIVWFIDEGKIYYGRQQNNGEISDYLSGYIFGNTFVVDYSTQLENLDICGWDRFIINFLEMQYIDIRNQA